MQQHLGLAVVVSSEADRVKRCQPKVARLSEMDITGQNTTFVAHSLILNFKWH